MALSRFIGMLILPAVCTPAGADTPRPQPNLIFVLTDDLRWDTLGCTGHPLVHTPHIDRLASRGVTFNSCFVTTSICCVSRASILTGQYERRHGIRSFRQPLTETQWARTYPVLLRQAGYRTGFIGKFGVGASDHVESRADAFDYWRGLPGGAGEHFIDPEDPTQIHATARFGEQALEFIAGCTSNQPFCLSISFSAPHARDGKPREFRPDPRDEALYTGITVPPPANATEEAFMALPDFVRRSEGRRRWNWRFATPEMFQRTMRDYCRLVTGIDRELGRIMDQLAEQRCADNTVVVFTSDNGWFIGERGMAGKWLMYEESIRIPLIIHDPRLPGRVTGRGVDAVVLNVDFAPTLLSLAGLVVPPTMQGRSLLPLLEGISPEGWRTDFFYEHRTLPDLIPPSEGVRTERWSYVRWMEPNPLREELYDLRADPLQMHNLAADRQHTETLAHLRTRWAHYRAELR
jgi:arylsulfatase A-like enzyme